MSRSPAEAFDPFLFDLPGADEADDPVTLSQVANGLVRHEVMIAVDSGVIETGEMVSRLVVRLAPDTRVRHGDGVAVSFHEGYRYTGFRTSVVLVEETEGGLMASLRAPERVVFSPGRQHLRLDGVLGARVMLEVDDALFPARGLDLSMGGLGVMIAEVDAASVHSPLLVHLAFPDDRLTLEAHVRSARSDGEDVRLGIEFVEPPASLLRRINAALAEDHLIL
ncbi:MAG: PilZ domain-containing protein [Myxococcales bacterium]|nr:PilZ domain-containing protein [Myxococcales bacterium]